MAFLDALGRTDALPQTTNSLVNLTLGLKSLKMQEAQQAQQAQTQRLQQQLLQHELRQREDQAAQQNRPLPLDQVLQPLAQTPSARKMLEQWGRGLGLVEELGGTPVVRAGKAMEAYQLLQTPQLASFNYELDVAAKNDIEQAIVALQQQTQDGKGGDKQQAQAQQAIQNLYLQRESLLESIDRYQLAGAKAIGEHGLAIPGQGVVAPPAAPAKLPSVGTDRNAKAGELFPDRRWEDLSGSERAMVNASVQRDRLDERIAEGSAKALAERRSDLTAQRNQVTNVIHGIDSLQDELERNPAVVGAPGAVSRAMTSLADQTKAFVNIVVPGSFDTFHHLSKYANIFRDTGIQSAELQSKLLTLSIGLAMAEGFEGREITDRKIELNLRRLSQGLGGGSAEIAFQVLEQLKTDLRGQFNTNASALTMDPLQPLTLADQPARTFDPSLGSPAAPDTPTIQILRRRPVGGP